MDEALLLRDETTIGAIASLESMLQLKQSHQPPQPAHAPLQLQAQASFVVFAPNTVLNAAAAARAVSPPTTDTESVNSSLSHSHSSASLSTHAAVTAGISVTSPTKAKIATTTTDVRAASLGGRDAELVLGLKRVATGIVARKVVKRRRRRRRRKRKIERKVGQKFGRWTDEEHELFLEGLEECGRDWRQVSFRIPTRTSTQIRSHAQKYFAKIEVKYDQCLMSHQQFYGDKTGDDHADDNDDHGSRDNDDGKSDNMHESELSDPNADASPKQSQAFHRTINCFPPSLKARIDRIQENPKAIEGEVASTMVALQKKYIELKEQFIAQRRKELGLSPQVSGIEQMGTAQHAIAI